MFPPLYLLITHLLTGDVKGREKKTHKTFLIKCATMLPSKEEKTNRSLSMINHEGKGGKCLREEATS